MIPDSELVQHAEALSLKALGFNEKTFFVYSEDGQTKASANFGVHNTNVPSFSTIPTYRQVFKWFRDKHKLHCEIIWDHSEPVIWYYAITKIGDIDPESKSISSYPDNVFKTPEEAELEGLKKLIEIVKNNA